MANQIKAVVGGIVLVASIMFSTAANAGLDCRKVTNEDGTVSTVCLSDLGAYEPKDNGDPSSGEDAGTHN